MRTILILDDDRVFRRLVVDALQKRGHRVLEAGRAMEADLLLSTNSLICCSSMGFSQTRLAWIGSRSSAARAGRHRFFSSSFWKSMRDFELVTNTLRATQLLRKPTLPAEIADRVDSLLGIPAPAAAP